jgi:NAD(P)-dependent dehydrogenase (short-subunit alcohol dehydrogenase family)
MFNLAGQTVLVVGGSSGIGLGAAKAAHTCGANVIIASRSPTKVRAAVEVVGSGAQGHVLDITDDAIVRQFFRINDNIDHVVVSAAQVRVAPIRELTLNDAYASMNSKFWGAYRVARAMPLRVGGSLTLVSGFLSARPKPGTAILSAINAAIEGLTRGLALEFAPVRVNCVAPGIINTPLFANAAADDARKAMVKNVAESLPVGIIGEPGHTAIHILAAISNPYLTGSTVYVDGGGLLR